MIVVLEYIEAVYTGLQWFPLLGTPVVVLACTVKGYPYSVVDGIYLAAENVVFYTTNIIIVEGWISGCFQVEASV